MKTKVSPREFLNIFLFVHNPTIPMCSRTNCTVLHLEWKVKVTMKRSYLHIDLFCEPLESVQINFNSRHSTNRNFEMMYLYMQLIQWTKIILIYIMILIITTIPAQPIPSEEPMSIGKRNLEEGQCCNFFHKFYFPRLLSLTQDNHKM